MQQQKIKVDIKDSVADTLFIPLFMRSEETKRTNDRILNDPMACEIVEKLDYDFSRYKNKKMSSIGTSIRARHFDKKVKAFVENKKNPVVISLGCGLDTRAERVGSEKGIYYEIDLPEVIKLREQLIDAKSNYYNVSMSMFDTSWMDEISQKHEGSDFIIVAEGVFMYFEEEKVKSLLTDIAKRFKGSELHFDSLSKWMSQKSDMHDTVKYTKAKFKWGFDGDYEIEEWNSHYKLQETALYMNQERKRWGMKGILLSLVKKFRSSSRMQHYQIV